MLSKTTHTPNPTLICHQHKSQTFFLNPFSNLATFNLKQNPGLQTLSRSREFGRRNVTVYSSVEPTRLPPSGPPPNTLSWIVAVAIAVLVPFISSKWGPLLKSKIETAMKVTEEVVEAVENVAEEVEKVAEDIGRDMPERGKFREAVDSVENLAERAAKDAGVVDDFIDKVQEEEEKTELFLESLKDESKKSQLEESNEEKSSEEKSNDEKLNEGKSNDNRN